MEATIIMSGFLYSDDCSLECVRISEGKDHLLVTYDLQFQRQLVALNGFQHILSDRLPVVDVSDVRVDNSFVRYEYDVFAVRAGKDLPDLAAGEFSDRSFPGTYYARRFRSPPAELYFLSARGGSCVAGLAGSGADDPHRTKVCRDQMGIGLF